jgi:DNA-binding NtrC family response regulator
VFKRAKQRVLEAFERQYLTRLLTIHCGNITHAAQSAGKDRRDLGKLLRKHGLDPQRFRAL